MQEKINLFKINTSVQPDNETILPVFLDLKDPFDLEQFQFLLQSTLVEVHDTIYVQLNDLVRCLQPTLKNGTPETDQAIQVHVGECPLEQYGTWVYFPWSRRMVHLLGKEEFSLVRTSRNNYKITLEEQRILSKKKVGVIGLSVGQSVSIAMAMERSFQELRIADFDLLDASNLNRIRTGVHHIGTKKTVITAREIAEIDPYLKVTCFHDGLHWNNIHKFFNEGGLLDAVIEECDSLEIKILSRQVAKKNLIPVIMDTSDRGMVDVERFDTEPERAIFHGMLDHVDLSELNDPDKRMEIIYAILDEKNISEKFKYSIGEIGKSIVTWPQLASAVLAGGAYAADVYRRIMLGAPIKSGRYYIDLDQLIK